MIYPTTPTTVTELIHISYDDTDKPTVSGKPIDFKDFFIQVCKAKVESDFDELGVLNDCVRAFTPIYGSTAIAYLCDCISAERVLPCKCKNGRKSTESKMKSTLLENFCKIFPDFTFISDEFQVNGVGRIDIYATYNERPVIIELKTGHKNPNLQLIAYGSQFVNPILIGITEEKLPSEMELPFIKYYTFDELIKKEELS